MLPHRSLTRAKPSRQTAPAAFGPLEAVHEAALLLRDDRICDCNRAACTLFASSRGRLLGRTPADLSPAAQPDGPDSTVLAAQRIRQARRGGVSRFHWLHACADGTAFLAEVLLISLDSAGHGDLLALIRDVTGRQMAQAAVRGILARQSPRFDTAAAVFFVQADRVVTAANPRTCRLFGLAPDELIGRDTQQLHPSREQFLEFGQEHYPRLREAETVEVVHPMRRKDGTVLPMRLLGMAVDRSGLTDVAVWVADIDLDPGTRRYCRHLEDAVDDLSEQLSQVRRQLEDRNVALREVLAAGQEAKAEMDRAVASNVQTAVMPLLDSLRRRQDRTGTAILHQLEQELSELGSPPPAGAGGDLTNLTPTELAICRMIRRGLSSKEIAAVQSVSTDTIQTHRRSIRKKLKITGAEVNLTTFLRNFSAL
jgi:PAS domain S-box-containing protein